VSHKAPNDEDIIIRGREEEEEFPLHILEKGPSTLQHCGPCGGERERPPLQKGPCSIEVTGAPGRRRERDKSYLF